MRNVQGYAVRPSEILKIQEAITNSADLTWAYRIPIGPLCLSVSDRYVNILTEGHYKIKKKAGM